MDEMSAGHYTAPTISLFAIYVILNVLVLIISLSTTSFTLVSGRIAVLNLWLTLIPASKTSMVLHLTGVPFERLMKFHKVTAFIGFAATVAHYVRFVYRMVSETINIDSIGVYPEWGLLAFICYALMSSLAIPMVREAKYKIFYVVHQLWIVAVVFTMLHFPMGSLNQLGFLPGLVLHIVDRVDLLCTHRISARGNIISSAKTAESSALVSSADTFSLRVLTKETNLWWSETKLYQSISSMLALIYTDANEGLGQYYFINAPAISLVEWHPFSVSQMNEKTMTFHIKTCKPGSWTAKLAKLMQDSAISNATEHADVEVKLRGPYGSLSVNLADYSHIILIAGGVGITPMLPILDSIRCQQRKYPFLSKVTIIWVARIENEQLFCESADRIAASADTSSSRIIVGDSTGGTDDRVERSNSADGDLEMAVIGHVDVGVTPKNQKSVGPSQYACVNNGASIIIEVGYYLTGANESITGIHEFTSNSSSNNKYSCAYGRPDLNSLAKKVAQEAGRSQLQSGSSSACALVCGPAAMSTAAAVACADHGIDYHLEPFGW